MVSDSLDRTITQEDLYFFREGTHVKLPEVLGAHLSEKGTTFAVWAPRARSVSVIGSFNGWDRQANPLSPMGGGIWQGTVTRALEGSRYRYDVEAENGTGLEKVDPFGFYHDQPPENASIVWNLDYQWTDQRWMAERAKANALDAPISIYEVHLGSWRRVGKGKKKRPMTYSELAETLVPYVTEMGFTHVEFMPVTEHPFHGSWGYQTTGYFAPTSRYGTPQEFMQLIDQFHQNGIGVILDWVPSHFPQDEHSLANFDGAHEFESADRRRGWQPDWDSFIFEYGRGEVRSFLLSSALFWLDHYHADGLRVDAVASMLYLDYSRKAGEWIPNEYGSRENFDAIGFIRRLNEDVYRLHPAVQTFAEESTAWPMVSKPTYLGGLGFGFKWDMGWMHDTLQYLAQDPVNRKYHHQELVFRSVYASSENFVLPLSHDEVVYGKGSLLAKMPGDARQKFANVRLLFAYMYALPGKKLLFMGDEFAQPGEWNHDAGLEWGLLAGAEHAGMRLLVGDLNRLYRTAPAFARESAPESFAWVEAQDGERNVIAFLRRGKTEQEQMLVACNFSGVRQRNYQMGVPLAGFWQEVLNTDAINYGGSGLGNFGGCAAEPVPLHGFRYSLVLDLPPLAAVYLKQDSSLQHL